MCKRGVYITPRMCLHFVGLSSHSVKFQTSFKDSSHMSIMYRWNETQPTYHLFQDLDQAQANLHILFKHLLMLISSKNLTFQKLLWKKELKTLVRRCFHLEFGISLFSEKGENTNSSENSPCCKQWNTRSLCSSVGSELAYGSKGQKFKPWRSHDNFLHSSLRWHQSTC